MMSDISNDVQHGGDDDELFDKFTFTIAVEFECLCSHSIETFGLHKELNGQEIPYSCLTNMNSSMLELDKILTFVVMKLLIYLLWIQNFGEIE